MKRYSQYSRAENEEAAKKGFEKLRKLLADPEAFEKWANEMLDESRRRRRSATTREDSGTLLG
jgi:hypothetical protein